MPTAKRSRSPGRPAGGSEELIRAVLETTRQHLAERGYSKLSVEEIARAAGMNKTSIYRRWPTKGELVLAALGTMQENEPPFRETGDLRTDLVALLRAKAARVSTPGGRAIARALMSIDDDEALAASIRARRYGLSTSWLQAAIERGELARDVDASFVSEMLLAPVLHRLLVTNEPADDVFVERVVDQVLAGLSPGPNARDRRAR